MEAALILAIDPGPIESGVCLLDEGLPVWAVVYSNEVIESMLVKCSRGLWSVVVIEMIASYGMPVGAEVFETCVWIGRFMQASQSPVYRLFRRDIKTHLCQSSRAKDSNVWAAIVDRFGGKDAAVGRIKSPGPLYGIKSHARAALAVALTWDDGVRSKGM